MLVKTLVTAITLTIAASSTHALAADAPSPTHKAAASGLVIGAVTGGPIGAFVGTVVGGEIFGRLFEQRRENKTLEGEVADLQTRLNQLHKEHKNEVFALNLDLDTVLALQAGQAEKRSVPIQFKTASSSIELQYREELKEIAQLLKRNKDATISLKGFADRRGNDSANLTLSEKRVRSVEGFLLQAGVAKRQIRGLAYGESRPLNAQESLENNFFDRRVDVELHLELDPQLATR